MHKLSVHLVVWNGAKYIPYIFDSLKKQSYKDWELLIIDNNSQDNTLELIKKELSDFHFEHRLIENKDNKGFAGGHNQAFKLLKSEYVLLLNQDIYLTQDCLEKAVDFLNKNKEFSSVSPRLMKWDFFEAQNNLQKSFTDKVDSLGLKVYRNRQVVEQYAQQNWHDLRDKLPTADELPVFGVSGALPIFRTSALKRIAYEGMNIFDESYHSYKEDVDLAFRLVSAGYKSCILLNVTAYHDRSAAAPKKNSIIHILFNKKNQSEFVRYHSYKNHLMTIFKNEYRQNFIIDLPWILWYELRKIIFFIFFDQKPLSGLKIIFNSNLLEKRRLIKNLRAIDWREMRKWWI